MSEALRDAWQNLDQISEEERVELREWLDSLDYVIKKGGPARTNRLLRQLYAHAHRAGVEIPFTANTPYINTIPVEKQPSFPGSREIERRIKSLIRWNAMAMVVRANRESNGIGGHISTFASSATLYEVGFNHFFRGHDAEGGADLIFFQGHNTPGFYARAFLEGRLSEIQLENFRQELTEGGGLSSYPHPWLMPDFWEFPTVSMGLGPIMAIYQARFNRYLEDRGFLPASDRKVWAFLGDGETDEPEALGAISLAAREKLDNLIFVVNCNLQRLDGPVRGNGKIIQELEAVFRGAGWNVVKVIWGSAWDPLLERYGEVLVNRMDEVVDGQWQKYTVDGPDFFRQDFFKGDPQLEELGRSLSKSELEKLNRGGHDPAKVYAAYKAAFEHHGAPTVILAKTVKGYGLGEAGEGKNITHQQKKLNEQELREFRSRFGIPISDEEVAAAPFYRPAADSPEMIYLRDRRAQLGGPVPRRVVTAEPLPVPPVELFKEFHQGTDGREVSTTMALVRILAKLLRDKGIGRRIVPIIPDEARTFGMEALFSQFGIYSHVGQLYEPVDAGSLMYYKEAKEGQILEEGITEAGATSSFIAAGTAYATHGFHMVPFYTFYSMFGLQRVGDLIWAAGDMRCRGFLAGATAGRTTLNGEGLQHQDGHSHLLAYPVPNLRAYDAAFAFELAVIIRDGLRRMFAEDENIFYYLTVENENYPMPPMPKGVEEGIIRGMYLFRAAPKGKHKRRAQILAAGPMVNQALQAQARLAEDFGVGADVWSVTSFKELYRDAVETERWNLLNPTSELRKCYFESCLAASSGPIVAVSDYVKALPNSLGKWSPRPLLALGTDGFGRSETRERLRDFFEVDSRFIALGVLRGLFSEGQINSDVVEKAVKSFGISPEKPSPALS